MKNVYDWYCSKFWEEGDLSVLNKSHIYVNLSVPGESYSNTTLPCNRWDDWKPVWLHKNIISRFTEPVCKSIYISLAPEYLKMPDVRKNGI